MSTLRLYVSVHCLPCPTRQVSLRRLVADSEFRLTITAIPPPLTNITTMEARLHNAETTRYEKLLRAARSKAPALPSGSDDDGDGAGMDPDAELRSRVRAEEEGTARTSHEADAYTFINSIRQQMTAHGRPRSSDGVMSPTKRHRNNEDSLAEKAVSLGPLPLPPKSRKNKAPRKSDHNVQREEEEEEGNLAQQAALGPRAALSRRAGSAGSDVLGSVETTETEKRRSTKQSSMASTPSLDLLSSHLAPP